MTCSPGGAPIVIPAAVPFAAALTAAALTAAAFTAAAFTAAAFTAAATTAAATAAAGIPLLIPVAAKVSPIVVLFLGLFLDLFLDLWLGHSNLGLSNTLCEDTLFPWRQFKAIFASLAAGASCTETVRGIHACWPWCWLWLLLNSVVFDAYLTAPPHAIHHASNSVALIALDTAGLFINH